MQTCNQTYNLERKGSKGSSVRLKQEQASQALCPEATCCLAQAQGLQGRIRSPCIKQCSTLDIVLQHAASALSSPTPLPLFLPLRICWTAITELP